MDIKRIKQLSGVKSRKLYEGIQALSEADGLFKGGRQNLSATIKKAVATPPPVNNTSSTPIAGPSPKSTHQKHNINVISSVFSNSDKYTFKMNKRYATDDYSPELEEYMSAIGTLHNILVQFTDNDFKKAIEGSIAKLQKNRKFAQGEKAADILDTVQQLNNELEHFEGVIKGQITYLEHLYTDKIRH